MRRLVPLLTMLCLLANLGFGAPKKVRRNVRSRTVQRAVVWDAETVNAAPMPKEKEKKGPGVLKAQVLLDRANFSVGEIDGATGKNLTRAIVGYQRAHSIAESGQIDEATWTALIADTAPVLVPYRITADDVKGPFEKLPEEMAEKAQLPSLAFESVSESFGERFHSSPTFIQTLNKGKDLSKEGEEVVVPNVLTNFVAKAATIVVSKSESTVTALDAKGQILAQYPASTGSDHDPLPIGEWKINLVKRDPPFFYNPALFWDAKPGDSKMKLPPGPNSPVGTVWIDLSKEHYGIHGTPEPSRIGYTQSHGCIRLTNWDALELAGLVGPGVKVTMKE